MDSSSDINICNPLHIDLIIQKVLKFVPLKDVKNCRMVCQQWNYLAEPFLGKLGRIIFNNSRSPSVFTDYFSQADRKNFQPFDTFVFDSMGVTIFDLHSFLMKMGKYVKKLELKKIRLWLNETDTKPIGQVINLDPLLELMRNLEELAIRYRTHPFVLSLHKLTSVHNVYLEACDVILKAGEERITPLKMHLKHVHFRENITITDFVDFSKCSDICIKSEDRTPIGDGEPSRGVVISFDFSRDTLNCGMIRLQYINILNWKTSKMTAERFHLVYNSYNASLQAAFIPTKELKIVSNFDTLSDLTLISKDVQKLTVVSNNFFDEEEFLNVEALDLPNLKSLKLSSIRWGTTTTDVFKIMSLFANCKELTFLELKRYMALFTRSNLDVSWIPKSVRKLNLAHIAARTILVGREEPIHLDVLIVYGFTSSSMHVKSIMKRIKSKVLIRKVELCEKTQASELKETVTDFVAFILEEKETENIVVEFIGVESLSPEDKAIFYKIVDKESAHYEFVGQRGKAITQEEFYKILLSHELGSFECYCEAKDDSIEPPGAIEIVCNTVEYGINN